MKTIKIFLFTGMILLCVCTLSFPGNLEPSGPPGSTMKTLDEIEPRIPIPGSETAASTYTISQSGSYYLSGDRVCSATGIQVDVDDVTIDLMGYRQFDIWYFFSFAVTIWLKTAQLEETEFLLPIKLLEYLLLTVVRCLETLCVKTEQT